jgi:hypothetical protein
MPTAPAALFWIWLAVTLVVLAHRHVIKPRRRSDPGPENGTPEEIHAEPAPVPVPVAAGAGLASAAPPEPMEIVSTLRGAPAAGVAEALMGIRMPCDLVPLVVDRLSTNHIGLSTTGYPAEAVGTALADELERLGYVLRPLSDHDLAATRGGTELHLRIQRPDVDGRNPEHPTARDHAVVVEIELR